MPPLMARFRFGPAWSRIQQERSVGAWYPFLALFSQLYGMGVRFRLWAYKRRLFKSRRLPGFVVSVGNLTAGGTGKTPAVIMLARWALKEGYRVAVLSRGYGGQYKRKILEVSDGDRLQADAQESGDEPYLLAKQLQGVPIVISKKRFLAGLFTHRKFGTEFFILDDGFQHLELKRDLDLVLLDALNPFGNGHLLPWGPLRERVDQLVRADVAIVTRFSKQASKGGALDFLKERCPAIPTFCADHLPERVVFPGLNEIREPGYLKGKRVLAFAGIARPEVFRDTLMKLGAEVVYFKPFRDHYPFEQKEIQLLIEMKRELSAQYLITTEKDWVRIHSFASAYSEMAYLSISFRFYSGREDFFDMVNSALSEYRRGI